MKKIFSLAAICCMVLGVCAQNNVLTYKAPQKINLDLTDFEPAGSSHTWDEETGIGTVTCSGEMTKIKMYAFSETDITEVNLPSTLTFIEYGAFYNCYKMLSVAIPNGVATIQEEAFLNVPHIQYSGTATGSPWGAKYVNKYVENNMLWEDETKSSLLSVASTVKTIDLPYSTSSIANNAMINTNATKLVCRASTVPTTVSGSFSGVTKSIPVIVPTAALASYSAADNWSEFTNLQALTTYTGLKIAGKAVDNGNMDDILGDGAASYDPTLKLLIVKKDIINNSSTYYTISSSIRHLEIMFTKGLKIKNEGGGAMMLGDTTTITGSVNTGDFVTISGNYTGAGANFGLGIDLRGLLLTFDGFEGKVEGTGMAIKGSSATKNYTVVFRNSSIQLANKAESGKPMLAVANVSYEGGSVLMNEGVTYENLGSTMGNGYKINNVAYDATVNGPIQIMAPFGITVKGTEVTPSNMGNVLGDGKVHFDVATNTLSLSDINESYAGTYIKVMRDSVKLYADSDCSISSTVLARPAIDIDGAGVQMENGRWTLKGGVGIVVTQPGFVIKYADLAITGSENGITTSDTLVCDNSRVRIANSVGVGIDGGVKLVGCEEVVGTHTDNHGVLIANRLSYSIYIGGTQISAAIMDNVLNDGKTVSLDDKLGKLTLTLKNANINTGANSEGIRISESDVEVVVKGASHVFANSTKVALDSKYDVTIKGGNNDTLYLDSTSCGIQQASNRAMKIEGLSVEIGEMANRGVLVASNGSLTLGQDAALHIQAFGNPFVCNGTFTMEDEIKIQEPTSAVFDQPYIKVNSAAIANGTEVLICSDTRIPTDIQSMIWTEDNKAARKMIQGGQLIILRDGKAYNAQGQLL